LLNRGNSSSLLVGRAALLKNPRFPSFPKLLKINLHTATGHRSNFAAEAGQVVTGCIH
jgi:hypothetical protein